MDSRIELLRDRSHPLDLLRLLLMLKIAFPCFCCFYNTNWTAVDLNNLIVSFVPLTSSWRKKVILDCLSLFGSLILLHLLLAHVCNKCKRAIRAGDGGEEDDCVNEKLNCSNITKRNNGEPVSNSQSPSTPLQSIQIHFFIVQIAKPIASTMFALLMPAVIDSFANEWGRFSLFLFRRGFSSSHFHILHKFFQLSYHWFWPLACSRATAAAEPIHLSSSALLLLLLD